MVIFNLAATVLNGLYRTWAVALGWAWFVQPSFGVDAPNFWMLFGVLSVLQLATMKSISKADLVADDVYKERHGKDASMLFLFANNLVFAVAITFTLVVMWIVKEVAF